MNQIIPTWREIKSDRNRISMTVIVLAAAAMIMSVIYVMNYFDYASTKSVLQYEYEQKVAQEIAERLGLRSPYDDLLKVDEAKLANFNPNELVHKERVVQNDSEVRIYYNGIVYKYDAFSNPLEHTCEPEDSPKAETIANMLFALFVFIAGIIGILYATNGELDQLLGAAKARGYMGALRDIENNDINYNLQMYQFKESQQKAEEEKGLWESLHDDIKEITAVLKEEPEKKKAKKKGAAVSMREQTAEEMTSDESKIEELNVEAERKDAVEDSIDLDEDLKDILEGMVKIDLGIDDKAKPKEEAKKPAAKTTKKATTSKAKATPKKELDLIDLDAPETKKPAPKKTSSAAKKTTSATKKAPAKKPAATKSTTTKKTTTK